MSDHHHVPHAAHELKPEASDRLTKPFMRFSSLASSGGIVLLLCTVVALVWSNSSAHQSYHNLFHETPFSIGLGDVAPEDDHAVDHPVEGAVEGDSDAALAHREETPVVDPVEPTGEGLVGGEIASVIGGEHGEADADPAADHGAGIKFSVIGKSYSLHWWINDFLMAIFFLLVGLEIKREILVGELSDVKRASLPIFAAMGGMVVPALIYTAFNYNNPDTVTGWGVPMATDIAFALGILALLGPRVPNSLKVFLASLAIADDLGALLVIAIFYTEELNMTALGYAGGVLAVLFAFNRMGFRSSLYYVLPGLVLWFFVYESGIHATIAGVLLALVIPVHTRVDGKRYARYTRDAIDTFEEHIGEDGKQDLDVRQRAAVLAIEKNNRFVVPLLNRMEHVLHPWVAFLIIPVFALANAGVEMHGGFVESVKGSVSMGVILGLFLGKPLGVTLFCFISVKLGLAKLPTGVTWRHILGAGFLAGIGFTMAIFIANLAYHGETAPYYIEHAKIGILIASFGASVVGLLILISVPSPKANGAAPKPKPELEPKTE
ncbi:MAG: NhaA family Na+:H+ antiporter [Phycisphaerales bacterium]|jgi:NhaA family Na+:H+ antiporter